MGSKPKKHMKKSPITCEKCPHCGALMREYWHSLTPGVVSALIKLHKAVIFYGRNEIHIHDEMKASGNYEIKLTDHEWNNFTKLRFHGLAAKCDAPRNNKSGHWLLTARGAQFLRGELEVPLRVRTYRNRVIDHSDELVGIRKFKDQIPYFETMFDYEVRKPAVRRSPEPQMASLFT
jgi:hypothetical protein